MTENRPEVHFNSESALRPRSIFRGAMPLLAGLMLEQLIGFTDVLFLGRYGEAELAAAGVAGILVLLFMMLGWGYCVGAQSLMSRANGGGDKRKVGSVFRQSAFFLFIAGLVIALASPWIFDLTLAKSIHSKEVEEAARSYVLWRVAALPVAFLCLLFRAFFVSILRPRVLTVSSSAMVLANCGLNAVLIFGLGPFPELGIAGAAIASAVSEVVCLIVFGVRLFMEKRWVEAVLCDSWRPQREVQKALFQLGRWLMLQEAVAFGVWLFFFVSVENVAGERGLAITNVVRQLGAILFLFVHAFGSTAGSLAMNLVGARKPELISRASRTGLWVCAAAMAPLAVFYAAAPDWVLGLITNFPDLIEDAKNTYYVMIVSYILTVPCYYFFFIIGTLGFARASFWVSITSALTYAVYVGILSGYTTSPAVLWTSDFVYGFVLGIGTWLVWRSPEARRLREASANAL
ncbi:MATE family efflux transporter [uncultured Sutterella sp.]|mgnify:FL=1|uniref:MATE family efflux transporter n=1 Tax=uncultured Sutterella sp. TaxID=286133 RepID=UPI0026314C3B|nr:MATE family efflux transporter [uncultured Sutterella sp.]